MKVVNKFFRADNKANCKIFENICDLKKKIAYVAKTLTLNCAYKNITDTITELFMFSFTFVLSKNNFPCK